MSARLDAMKFGQLVGQLSRARFTAGVLRGRYWKKTHAKGWRADNPDGTGSGDCAVAIVAAYAAALAEVARRTEDAARWRFVASHLHVCEVSEPEGRPAVFCGDEHGNIPVLNDALEQLYLDAFHDPKRTLASIDEVVDAARFADAPGGGAPLREHAPCANVLPSDTSAPRPGADMTAPATQSPQQLLAQSMGAVDATGKILDIAWHDDVTGFANAASRLGRAYHVPINAAGRPFVAPGGDVLAWDPSTWQFVPAHSLWPVVPDAITQSAAGFPEGASLVLTPPAAVAPAVDELHALDTAPAGSTATKTPGGTIVATPDGTRSVLADIDVIHTTDAVPVGTTFTQASGPISPVIQVQAPIPVAVQSRLGAEFRAVARDVNSAIAMVARFWREHVEGKAA